MGQADYSTKGGNNAAIWDGGEDPFKLLDQVVPDNAGELVDKYAKEQELLHMRKSDLVKNLLEKR